MTTKSSALNLMAQLESVLFAAGKPIKLKRLAEVCEVTVGDVEQALVELARMYTENSRGLTLITNQGEVALATHPASSDLVKQFLKKEELGELTRPQLEALSVISYRGPVSKAELEQLRGVNCSLILRNLQIRGLVEAVGEDSGLPRYQVTVDYLRYLGINSTHELPNYDSLSQHANLERILNTTPTTPTA